MFSSLRRRLGHTVKEHNLAVNLFLRFVQTDATTPKIVAPRMLRVVASVLQWCANECYNSQQQATTCNRSANGRNM